MSLRRDRWLDRLLCIGWFVTVFSMLFYDALLNFPLPIGGHMFLFRGAILFTMAVFFLWELRNRTFFVRGQNLTEKILSVLMVAMVLYGGVSVLWSMEKGAWLTKMLTMVLSFGFLFIYVKLGKNEKVQKITMWLLLGTTLVCLVGGLSECFAGCYFETLHEEWKYRFFGAALQAPIFTFYNPNGFSVSTMLALMVLLMYAFEKVDTWSRKVQNLFIAAVCLGVGLCLFLYCADEGRLTVLSLPVLVIGILVWMLLRMKRGILPVLATVAVSMIFVLVGENYVGICEFLKEAKELPGIQWNITQAFGKNPNGTLTNFLFSSSAGGGTVVQQADGIRVSLLRNSFEMIGQSRLLGIGLGNAELRMAAYDNASGHTNVHCFLVELVLEFGIFALIPLVALFGSVFYNYYLLLRYSILQKDRKLLANTVFQLFTVVLFPVMSTINATSWTIMPMWLYIGYLLIDQSKKLETVRREAVAFKTEEPGKA